MEQSNSYYSMMWWLNIFVLSSSFRSGADFSSQIRVLLSEMVLLFFRLFLFVILGIIVFLLFFRVSA